MIMSKKLFSFRLEEDKIELVKDKAKSLKISTQALLEQLVDLAISDAINLDNKLITLNDNSFDNEVITGLKKLITDNNKAIKLLSDKVTKLESYHVDNGTIAFKEQLSSNTNQDDNNLITTEREPKQNLTGNQDDSHLIISKEASTENKDDIEPVKEIKKPSESLQSVTDDDKQGTKIKSYEDAIALAKKRHEEGKSNAKIAKELEGKYWTVSGKSTKWRSNQVKTIVESFS
jgi:hypothetical protein